jgi:phage-related protein
VANNQTYIDIDCETMEAYCGSTNMNANITLTSGKFPELASGSNAVAIGSGITQVTITPRWWIL